MQRIQNEWNHDYLVSPSEYDDTSDRLSSTYDQFIQLRDTLVYSGKKYKGKAWARLIIWEKEETVEIQYKNWSKMSFQPDYLTNPERLVNPWDNVSPTYWMLLQEEGWYVTWLAWSSDPADQALAQTYWVLAFKINKDWHYTMFHKEEILLQATTKKVYCFLEYFKYGGDDISPYPATWIPIAVFDWQWEVSKQFNTSWTEPNGTVTVSFKLWELIQKMTAFGYNERNLNKNDILVLRCIDNERDQNPNELVYQRDSNFIQINYTDLPLKY